MDFDQAQARFRELKALFAAGDLTETEFKAKLEELMVQDEGGNWWMIGYETERWYRYDGTSWVPSDPSERRVSAQPSAPGKPRLAESAPAGRRVSPALFVVAALIVLMVGGYFVFGSSAAKSRSAAAPTQAEPTSTPQPAAHSSQTPTPEIQLRVSAAASQVNLYQGPSLKYSQVKAYAQGAQFDVLARDPAAQWLLVRATDGNEGWVYFQWIDAEFDPSLLPTPSFIAPPPPTATRQVKEKICAPPPGCTSWDPKKCVCNG